MPKVVTLLSNGYYYPKLLTESEVVEYERIGYKTTEVSQETIDQWKEHCKEIENWHKFWMEIDNEVWNEE